MTPITRIKNYLNGDTVTLIGDEMMVVDKALDFEAAFISAIDTKEGRADAIKNLPVNLQVDVADKAKAIFKQKRNA